MDKLLQQFYNDEHTRDAVKDFLTQFLKEKAGEMAFSGESTEHIKLAKESISEAWNKLELLYAKKEEKKIKNKAR